MACGAQHWPWGDRLSGLHGLGRPGRVGQGGREGPWGVCGRGGGGVEGGGWLLCVFGCGKLHVGVGRLWEGVAGGDFVFLFIFEFCDLNGCAFLWLKV